MVDIFEEVEGQLRSDRYRTLAIKALPWIAGVVLLALVIALGVWFYGSHRHDNDAKASEAYAAGLEALQAGDTATAASQFNSAANAGSKGYRALSLMQQGGLKLRAKNPTEAVALFDEATGVSDSPLLADTARLQAVYVLMDTGNQLEINGRLKPLLEEGRPYRAEAREAQAMTRLSAGQIKDARDDFVVLSQSLDTPTNIRSRAEAAIGIIDSGVASSVPAVIKAAKAISPESLAAALPSSPPQVGTAQ